MGEQSNIGQNDLDLEKKWSFLPIEVLIYSTPEMVVFLDKELDVDWQTTDEFDDAFDKKHANCLTDWGEIQNQVSVLHGVPINYLSGAQRLSFRRMVAEALARGLQGDFDNARTMLVHAQTFVQARNEEISRTWFLEASSVCCVLIVLVALLVIVYIKHNSLDSTLELELALSGSAGALGALLSVFQRLSKTPLDPTAGRKLHYYEGTARVLTGVIAGWVSQFMVKLGLVLSILADKGWAAIFIIGFIAGISERFLPTLIQHVETQASSHPHNKQ
jgi:hypothetical protein